MPLFTEVANTTVWQALIARGLLFLPQLGIGVALFVVFWIASLVADRVVVRVAAIKRLDPDLAVLLGRVASITLLLVGAMTALGTIGIDVSALVAGLGLTGFALGFALKDIISNALAGILVIIYEPFRRGDAITVTGFEGSVEEINLRYTVLSMEGKRAFIPNANLFTNPVVVQKRGWVAPLPPDPTLTHVIVRETEYSPDGGAAGAVPGGKFAAGTRVKVIGVAGGMSIVESEAGVKAFVPTGAIGPAEGPG